MYLEGRHKVGPCNLVMPSYCGILYLQQTQNRACCKVFNLDQFFLVNDVMVWHITYALIHTHSLIMTQN